MDTAMSMSARKSLIAIAVIVLYILSDCSISYSQVIKQTTGQGLRGKLEFPAGVVNAGQLEQGEVIVISTQQKARVIATGEWELGVTNRVAGGENIGGSLGKGLPQLPFKIVGVVPGYRLCERIVAVGDTFITLKMEPLETTLEAINIDAVRARTLGIRRLEGLEGAAIYEAKKSEVIVLSDLVANIATASARQIYARVPGLTVWESDPAGMQLSIGARGLTPNRTSSFNTRQNGYDIAADALGYPESYYTPPPELCKEIELVRGAAALQYGTQFGGQLNFALREPEAARPLDVELRQAVGSWGFVSSTALASGSIPLGKGGDKTDGKLNYLAFGQYKQGEGWRKNSQFEQGMGFGQIGYSRNRFQVKVEYTRFRSLAQQPGGLTDALYQIDARQSLRQRNWFLVDWQLGATTANYVLSDKDRVNVRVFALWAKRQAIGNQQAPNRADLGQERNLLDGDFANLGAEARYVREGYIGNKRQHKAALLAGVRVYQGFGTNRQGFADSGSGARFEFADKAKPGQSDYGFPSQNAAAFVEAILPINRRLNVVPGVRTEYIRTQSRGNYTTRITNLAGNTIAETTVFENETRARRLMLLGLGGSYKWERAELYANACQNYRAVSFNDIRIDNPSLRTDPGLRDERGYTMDLGFRSRRRGIFQYDVSVFWVAYRERIGLTLRVDSATFNDYRLRTNLADAHNVGFEAFGEVDLLPALDGLIGSRLDGKNAPRITVFSSFAYVDARYSSGKDATLTGKYVEYVPPVVIRTGVTAYWKALTAGVIYGYTDAQYTDATNAKRSASGVNGRLDGYGVLDANVGVNLPAGFRVEGACSNVMNVRYATRRAEGYPGPGLIPADGRGYYITAIWKMHE
jgi:Fe(3+) dicitrate transport protein